MDVKLRSNEEGKWLVYGMGMNLNGIAIDMDFEHPEKVAAEVEGMMREMMKGMPPEMMEEMRKGMPQ